jgi:hypothetical protein
MRGRLIEPLEDLDLPDGEEFTLALNPPEPAKSSEIISAIRNSAGAWSDVAHPDLATREDVIARVSEARAGFIRNNAR